MLLLPNPLRLMLGYWLGAMLTSIALGILIVFALEGSTAVTTTKNTLSPVADIVLGCSRWCSRSPSRRGATSA